MLLRTRDANALSVFDAQFEHYLQLSPLYMYEGLEAVLHFRAMAQFVAYHVFSCLHRPQLSHKVDCLLNPHEHGALYLANVHRFHLRAVLHIRRQQLGETGDVHLSSGYSCDICRVGVHVWETGTLCLSATTASWTRTTSASAA